MAIDLAQKPQLVRRLRDDSGQAMVEGALTLLLFLVFLFAIFEGGRILQVQHSLTDAAREGARLSVAPYTQTDTLTSAADIDAFVRQYLRAASLNQNLAVVNINQNELPPSAGPYMQTRYTRVRVSYPYRVMTLGMFGMLNITLTGDSLMRNETSTR